MPVESKSTDKLILIDQMIERLPADKIKSIGIHWEEVYGELLPDVIIEMYEDYPDKNEMEKDEHDGNSRRTCKNSPT